MATTQSLMSGGNIHNEPFVLPKLYSAANCSLPLCKASLSGKGRRTGLKSTDVKLNAKHSDVIKYCDLLPGDCVSTDQFECRVKKRLPGSKIKEDLSNMYSGGTIFVDNASSTIIIYNQVSL